jgi:hypothetical protein
VQLGAARRPYSNSFPQAVTGLAYPLANMPVAGHEYPKRHINRTLDALQNKLMSHRHPVEFWRSPQVTQLPAITQNVFEGFARSRFRERRLFGCCKFLDFDYHR